MKTKEELNKLKEEFKDLNEKLVELTDEELEQVSSGFFGTSIINTDTIEADTTQTGKMLLEGYMHLPDQ